MTHAELLRVAHDLQAKLRVYRAAHFAASDHLRVGHYALGFLLILASAVVSGSVLQATDGNPSQSLTLAAGALSVAVVVLTSIQTTFKLGERAEAHRSAADGFGRVERRLEVFIHRAHPNLEKAWDELTAITEAVGNVEAGAPGFVRLTYDRAREKIENQRRTSGHGAAGGR